MGSSVGLRWLHRHRGPGEGCCSASQGWLLFIANAQQNDTKILKKKPYRTPRNAPFPKASARFTQPGPAPSQPSAGVPGKTLPWRSPGKPVSIPGSPPPSSGTMHPNKEEVGQKRQETCMDEQVASGQTQPHKGSLQRVEARTCSL